MRSSDFVEQDGVHERRRTFVALVVCSEWGLAADPYRWGQRNGFFLYVCVHACVFVISAWKALAQSVQKSWLQQLTNSRRNSKENRDLFLNHMILCVCVWTEASSNITQMHSSARTYTYIRRCRCFYHYVFKYSVHVTYFITQSTPKLI